MSANQNLLNEVIQLYRQGELELALKKIKTLIQKGPKNPDLYNIAGAISMNQGHLKNALKYCKKAIQLAPSHADAYNNLGAIYKEKGLIDRTLQYCTKAIQLNPNHFHAYNNIANALKLQGKVNEAIETYHKALSINPNFVEGFYNLGNILRETGAYDQAIAYYKKALSHNPNLGPAYNNIAGIYLELGDDENAFNSYLKLISIGQESIPALQALADILQRMNIQEYSESLDKIFIHLLATTGTIRPNLLATNCILLLKHHPKMIEMLDHPHASDINILINELANFPLLTSLFRKALIPDIDFEKFLTILRQRILLERHHLTLNATTFSFIENFSFLCLNNEYVFYETPEETAEVETLASQSLTEIDILLVSLYRPLHTLKHTEEKTRALSKELYKRHFSDRDDERQLKADIPSISMIENETSTKVQAQYEQNPYPRWIDAEVFHIPETYLSIAKRKLLVPQDNVDSTRILIAGCGTGQHSLTTATRFHKTQVTAIDLSRESLAYAMRKTKEFDLKNITYFHGDILNVSKLEKTFPHIESVGVLHHMKDPMAGWQSLVDILEPNGIMLIGLYSKYARQEISRIKTHIHEKELDSSPMSIRELRKEIMDSENSQYGGISTSKDFYSMSNCRDLLFHVQEHLFTIPTIEQALHKLGLTFLGFDLDKKIIHTFIAEHGKDALYDLSQWHQFEESHPHTFGGMYQFWTRKL
ncbi:MAG: tetratricopeptide repeat protein [Terasakiella sp.]|uniref:tetratricopeptide repeat protein n=1 Tax=unclassified Terasakiella TaxID=2614952 RepID=UPI003B00432C